MKTLMALAFAAGLGLAATPSQAMTVAPVNSAGIVIQVAGGCGPGWHRGPRGGCLRNYAHPRRHACPRGYHLGPGGRCRGNR
jgi:hypothetical protein